MRQDDLASMAGTTRPTVNRLLQRLQDDGIVALRRGHLAVLDPATLAPARRLTAPAVSRERASARRRARRLHRFAVPGHGGDEVVAVDALQHDAALAGGATGGARHVAEQGDVAERVAGPERRARR